LGYASAVIVLRAAGLWLLVSLASGCAPAGPVRAALYEDLPSLRLQIQQAERAGKLDRAHVAELAKAVASREVASATGASGVRHVRALLGCAHPMLSALRQRAEIHDDPGAEAMLALLSVRDAEPGALVSRYARETDPAWRAVAARAALDRRDALTRRSWFVDSDQRVRRAAFEAALFAPEPSDLPVLLESFRLDPDPLSRSLSARAAGAIGGEAAVLGLKDRYARADEGGRLTLIEAWSMPAAYESGGDRELRIVAESGEGLLAIAAADALLRSGDADGSLVGLLVTAIDHGTEDERRLAVRLAPTSDPRVLAALDRARNDSNPEVRVIVLARLLSVKARTAEASKALREMAARKDGTADEARAALAAFGDRSVVSSLVEQSQKGEPWQRGRSAVALYRLGETVPAAKALADADPGVRISVSCGILAAR
jgi:hypothetical protein